jgi:formylglycine-generating enzyme required for sulfatase activity
MLGNVYEWCQDRYSPYPAAKDEPVNDDINISSFIIDKDSRLLRGGSFTSLAAYVRAAYRFWLAPVSRLTYLGFRPARTYP